MNMVHTTHTAIPILQKLMKMETQNFTQTCIMAHVVVNNNLHLINTSDCIQVHNCIQR